jgi:hypothetical protein
MLTGIELEVAVIANLAPTRGWTPRASHLGGLTDLRGCDPKPIMRRERSTRAMPRLAAVSKSVRSTHVAVELGDGERGQSVAGGVE